MENLMTQTPEKLDLNAHKFGWLFRYLAVLLFAFIAVGLFLTHFQTFALFMGAIPLSWLIVTVQKNAKLIKRKWLLLAFFVLLIPLCAALFYFLIIFFSAANVEQYDKSVYHYSVSITLLENGNFQIVEKAQIIDHPNGADVEPILIELPPSAREISGTKIGLVMNEVTIAPLGLDEEGDVNTTLPDGTPFQGPFCSYSCPETEIELIDFPISFFYTAKNAENLKSLPYLNTETIQWNGVNPDQGISFAYNPYPFPLNIITPLLQMLKGIYLGESNPYLFLFLLCCIFVPVFLYVDLPTINLHVGKKIFGDNVEGDKIDVGNISDSINVAVGRNSSAQSEVTEVNRSLPGNEEYEEN